MRTRKKNIPSSWRGEAENSEIINSYEAGLPKELEMALFRERISNATKNYVLLSRLVLKVASVVVFLLALPVLFNAHLNGGLFGVWSPMQFNTALTFVLVSVGLHYLSKNRHKFTQGSGALIAVTGGLTLFQYVVGIDLGIDELFRKAHSGVYSVFLGRMAPNSAISFFFLGLSFVVLGSRNRGPKRVFAGGILAALPFAFALVTLAGYILGMSTYYGWGSYALMALPTAVALLTASAAILAGTLLELRATFEGRVHVVPLCFTFSGFTVSIFLWQSVLVHDAKTVERVTDLQIEVAGRKIEKSLEGTALALKRMATRIEYLGARDVGYLSVDANSYIRHLPGLTRIGLVDQNYRVTWSYPNEFRHQVVNFNQASEPRRKAAFDRAKSNPSEFTLSQSVELRSGGTGFLMPIALRNKGKVNGFLYATVTAQKLFESVLDDNAYNIRIGDDRGLFFTKELDHGLGDKRWLRKQKITIGDSVWQFEMAPSLAILRKEVSIFHVVILLVGIALSLLIGLFLDLFFVSREQRIKIAEKDASFRLMVNGIHDYAIVFLDPEGGVVTWNTGAETIFGYPADEIVGKNLLVLCDSTDKKNETIRLFLFKAALDRDSGGQEYEGLLCDKNGRAFWGQIVLRRVSLEDGKHVGFAMIARDLTTEKKLEQERQEILTHLDIALEASALGIWSLDIPTGKVWRSNGHDQIFGHARALVDWDMEKFFEHVIPEDRQKVRDHLQEAYKAESSQFQFRIRRADDHSIRWISIECKTYPPGQEDRTQIIGTIKDITQSKLEMEERATFSQWQRAILQGANYSIISTDVEGVIQTFNRSAEVMLGYRADEVIGKQTPKIFHELSEVQNRALVLSRELGVPIEAGFDSFVAKARSLDCVDQAEWTYVRKDGTKFPVNLSVTALRNEKREVTGYLGIASDITEQRKVLTELQSTTKKLKAIFDASPVGILVLDPQFNVTIWNPACEKIFGWSEREVLGKPQPFVIRESENESLANLESVKKSKNPVRFQVDRITKKGTKIKIESAAMSVFDDEGNIVGIVSIMSDITEKDFLQRQVVDANTELLETLEKVTQEQQRAIASAAEAESLRTRLALALQSSRIGVWDWDITQDELNWDDRMYELYGVKKEQFAGAYDAWLNGLHPDDRDFCDDEIRKAIEGEKEFNTEFRVNWPDGSVKYIRAFGLVRRDEEGNAVGMTGVNWDITADKTRELELRAAQEKAIRASQAKSEFLANMSHEIRTPINGVLGMTGVLLDTKLNSEQKDYAENIRRSAEALLTVINDILDFSKVEAGKMELETIEFNLAEVLSDSVRTLGFSAKQKNLHIKAEGIKKWPNHFIGDPGRIRQVLTNLLSNAIKFSTKGDINVRVFEKPTSENGVMIRIEVEDHGIGIPPQALGRMLQAFSQADASTTRRFGGTGLGLSICKRLVQMMGGQIDVISTEGRGSTFWFEVPLRIGSKIKKEKKKRSVEKLTAGKKPYRVLVAEDNPINQKVAVLFLNKLGIHADTVANGNEAIDALRNVPYDLVLMDCQMPELDGYEATRIIRSSTTMAFREIPIIAMTANAVSGDKERCLAVGMNDYVGKPVGLEELSKALKPWLKKGRKKNLIAKKANTIQGENVTVSDAVTTEPVASVMKEQVAPPPPVSAEVVPLRSSSGSIDWSVIEDLRKLDEGTNSDIAAELSELFAKTVPEKLKKMGECLSRGDRETLRREAHSLKSSGGNIGARKFSKLCEELEHTAEKATVPELSGLFKAISDEFSVVSRELSVLSKKAA